MSVATQTLVEVTESDHEALLHEALLHDASLVEEELLVEEVSIDGMCGVY